MAAEWHTHTLGELTINHDGKRKPVKEADRKPGSYPYYGASGIVDYVDDYLIDGEYLLIAEDGENLRTRQTPIAFMAIGKSWVNNHAHIVTGNDKADTRFLMYAVQSVDIGPYLTGAVMPKLTQGNLNRILITCPPIDEQRAIASILGTLDDKIELNRRMNKTLEAIARAIFKSWFIDFDPVRAKANSETSESICHRLGLTPEILNLFPSCFHDTELGAVPEGWEVSSLGKMLDVLETGRRPKGGVGSFTEGVPSVGAENILGVGIYDYGKTRYVPEDFYVSMKAGHVQNYDVLLYKDGGKPGDFRPRVSMFGNKFPFKRLAINEHVFRLRSQKLGQSFLYFQLEHERVLADLRHRGAKAAIPGINQSDVSTLNFLLPSGVLLNEFDKIVTPILAAILERSSESRTIAELRDLLRPRLLSGDLRVPLIGAA